MQFKLLGEIVDTLNKINRSVNSGQNFVATNYYTFAENETPAGLINGANDIFTLANTPAVAGSLQVFLNGMYQTPAGEDYTLVGLTITFVNAPLTGSILRAFYKY